MSVVARLGVVFVLLFGMVACAERPEAVNDLLFFQTPGGVTVVRAGASKPSFSALGGVPSHDWTAIVQASRSRGSTEVTASTPSRTGQLWAREVPGSWNVKVVSEDGNLTALGPVRERYWEYGRRSTSLMVVGREGRKRTFELNGNYEPEAFSTDNQSLFLLSYLPARAPSRYQVRRLDLATGRVHAVYTPDEHLQGAMRGTARVQAMSTDGSRLYTLYTLKTPAGPKAFVHVLSLDELWAHCIDLPDDFAETPESAALAVSSERDRLYVANGATGAVTEIDPDSLAVERTADLAFGRAEETFATAGRDALYLASGTRLTRVALDDLSEARAWTLPDVISGLQLATDGSKIFAGVKKQVFVFDVLDGRRVQTIDPPGVRRVGQLGRIGRSVQRLPDKLLCAC